MLKKIFCILATAALAALLVREWSATAVLREELLSAQGGAKQLGLLRDERDRLASQEISSEARSSLDQEHAELTRLRVEAAALRKHIQSGASAKAPGEVPTKPLVSAEAWTDSGRATPVAAFRTAIWSTLQGDMQALAGLLAFEPEARRRLDDIFARLPAETRAEFGTADAVFATLLATQIPKGLQTADVQSEELTGNGEMTLRMRLRRQHGTERETRFRFARDAIGWRLLVPADVVSRYETLLTGKLRLEESTTATK